MFGNEVQMRMFLAFKKLSQNFIIVFCYYKVVVNCVVIDQMALRFGLSHINCILLCAKVPFISTQLEW